MSTFKPLDVIAPVVLIVALTGWLVLALALKMGWIK